MKTPRHKNLPQLDGGIFLSDGGLETSLIFLDGIELPHFAAFALMRDAAGRKAIRNYYEPYLKIAKAQGAGFILETPTWRASSDWGAKLGWSEAEITAVNSDSIAMMFEIKAQHASPRLPIVVSGAIGPRGDGYDPGLIMSAKEAADYHAAQIVAFADAGAELASAFTMTNAPEAIGIVMAARKAKLPVVISFTLETDGRLPTGQRLGDAIRQVDAATNSVAAYFMINCAHPSHFEAELNSGDAAMARIRGLRANASRRSHQELNDAPDLDAGDPVELGGEYCDLMRRHPQIVVVGGCCGTDHRHIGEIGKACCGKKAA
ncbi:MAG: homocysteine S-methyltransferase family protein [Hyphomicrobium sp.]